MLTELVFLDCRHALEAGLNPEQVLQLQEFSKKLRSGLDVTIQKESAVIGDMRKRMIVLEERLARALAYGDLPKHMRGIHLLPVVTLLNLTAILARVYLTLVQGPNLFASGEHCTM
jgi:hypothetical protein